MNENTKELEMYPTSCLISDLTRCVENTEKLIEEASELIGFDLMDCTDYIENLEEFLDGLKNGAKFDGEKFDKLLEMEVDIDLETRAAMECYSYERIPFDVDERNDEARLW